MGRYGLVGMPLGHSHSKALHEALCHTTYDLVETPPEQLEPLLHDNSANGYLGLNVTIPYKQTVMPYCSKIDPLAERIGSVNTLVRQPDGSLHGFNTDYAGFLSLAKAHGIVFQGKKVLIAGTGGTSHTAQTAALDEGAAKVILLSRKKSTGQALPDRVQMQSYDNQACWQDCDILINTTPVGMFPKTDGMPLDPALLPRLSGLLDVIYNPLRTRLCWWAKEHGIPGGGGLPMLAMQAVHARKLFDGRTIPVQKADEVLHQLACSLQNPVLIGMPGSGKSTLGRLLADRLGRRFVDTDAQVEEAAGCPIPEIFAREGEAHFRLLESAAIRTAVQQKNVVIAVGGGAILSAENRYQLGANGLIFHIKRPAQLLDTTGRPLSRNPEALHLLEQERMPLYTAMADHTVENTGNAGQTADHMAELFRKQPLV